MIEDRQSVRWAEARQRHHQAVQQHRVALAELDRATSELVTAGAALAERVRLTDTRPTPTLPGRRAA